MLRVHRRMAAFHVLKNCHPLQEGGSWKSRRAGGSSSRFHPLPLQLAPLVLQPVLPQEPEPPQLESHQLLRFVSCVVSSDTCACSCRTVSWRSACGSGGAAASAAGCCRVGHGGGGGAGQGAELGSDGC